MHKMHGAGSGRRAFLLAAALALACAGAGSAPAPAAADSGQPETGKPADDPSRVDAAIRRGLAFLKSSQQADGSWRDCSGTTALALKAIVCEGAPAGYEEAVARAADYLLAHARYNRVYETALLAMALQDLDPTTYREAISKCRDFLEGAQLPHGMWTYGKPGAEQAQAAAVRMAARSAEAPAEGGQSKAADPTEKSQPQPGDNSNTQFALLGLRAARWAGLDVDLGVIRKTQSHFMMTQQADGGWGYKDRGVRPTGSMTCAALASLCILDDVFKAGGYFDRRKIRKDNVAKGAQWMRDHFSVAQNPGGANYYYYMYSLERAGILIKRKQFGEHDWFAEGAPAICARQHADGSWGGQKQGRFSAELDTAFAILFLKEGAAAHRAPQRVAWIEE